MEIGPKTLEFSCKLFLYLVHPMRFSATTVSPTDLTGSCAVTTCEPLANQMRLTLLDVLLVHLSSCGPHRFCGHVHAHEKPLPVLSPIIPLTRLLYSSFHSAVNPVCCPPQHFCRSIRLQGKDHCSQTVLCQAKRLYHRTR